MKVLTIVGARPQFIKAAPLSNQLRLAGVAEVLVHTGQHYDREMSEVFFDELGIPAPSLNLNVGSGSHGQQTGRMLELLDGAIRSERPDGVVVFGDTNSTLAGAVAAAKLQVRCAHVEAGLRSFNRAMPEEINRILVDHASHWLFCPSATAVDNLRKEGIVSGVHHVGDIMFDAVAHLLVGLDVCALLDRLSLRRGEYLLATCHRAANTDSAESLQLILNCLAAAGHLVVFPVHPRTRLAIQRYSLAVPGNIRLLPPVGYREMLGLVSGAKAVLTDSGGVQKEAFWLSTPCVTLRSETEWVETVAEGWNTVTGLDPDAVAHAVSADRPTASPSNAYGSGGAAKAIVDVLIRELSSTVAA